jgi:hypothetical protein
LTYQRDVCVGIGRLHLHRRLQRLCCLLHPALQQQDKNVTQVRPILLVSCGEYSQYLTFYWSAEGNILGI